MIFIGMMEHTVYVLCICYINKKQFMGRNRVIRPTLMVFSYLNTFYENLYTLLKLCKYLFRISKRRKTKFLSFLNLFCNSFCQSRRAHCAHFYQLPSPVQIKCIYIFLLCFIFIHFLRFRSWLTRKIFNEWWKYFWHRFNCQNLYAITMQTINFIDKIASKHQKNKLFRRHISQCDDVFCLSFRLKRQWNESIFQLILTIINHSECLRWYVYVKQHHGVMVVSVKRFLRSVTVCTGNQDSNHRIFYMDVFVHKFACTIFQPMWRKKWKRCEKWSHSRFIHTFIANFRE